MPEPREGPANPAPPPSVLAVLDAASLEDRLASTPGLAVLLAEAEATWRARAVAAGDPIGSRPGWRAFEDAFPTFYEFTNRPR